MLKHQAISTHCADQVIQIASDLFHTKVNYDILSFFAGGPNDLLPSGNQREESPLLQLTVIWYPRRGDWSGAWHRAPRWGYTKSWWLCSNYWADVPWNLSWIKSRKCYWKCIKSSIYMAQSLQNDIYFPCNGRPPVSRDHLIQWHLYTGFTVLALTHWGLMMACYMFGAKPLDLKFKHFTWHLLSPWIDEIKPGLYSMRTHMPTVGAAVYTSVASCAQRKRRLSPSMFKHVELWRPAQTSAGIPANHESAPRSLRADVLLCIGTYADVYRRIRLPVHTFIHSATCAMQWRHAGSRKRGHLRRRIRAHGV